MVTFDLVKTDSLERITKKTVKQLIDENQNSNFVSGNNIIAEIFNNYFSIIGNTNWEHFF